MLDIVDLDFRIAGRPIFEKASAQIAAGRHIGVVGRNGVGKSTLLRLIAGAHEPDGGEIRLAKEARLGWVAQEAPGGDATPLDLVLASDAERARLLAEAETASPLRRAEIEERLRDIGAHAAEARAAMILDGLGFDHAAQRRPMSSFSGGWRMRVALAGALFAEPDLLLLDEPTNHLDLEAALWLERFLQRWPGAILLVSHDRAFLNSVVDGVWHVERGRLTAYRGDYDNFVRTRAERIAQQGAEAARVAKQRAHMQAFVDRFRAKASKARQAQSRLKALAKLTPIAAIERDADVVFQLPEPTELAPPLVALDGAEVGYGGPPILRGLSLRVDPDDRIALIGANGNGKSTLAKAVAGRLAVSAGARTASSKLKIGFFAQHQIEELDPDASPYEHLRRLMPEAKPERLRGVLGRFGFSGQRADQACGTLSGGEKARLTFCLITRDAPQLLILDEPTNHLDIEAREALVEALADFQGAVIIVSHDRHLVDLVADRLWLVREGRAEPFEGAIEDYEALVLRAERAAARPAAAPAAGGEPGEDRKAQRKSGADRRRETAPLRKELAKLEAELSAAQTALAKLDQRLASPKTYAGGGGELALLSLDRERQARAVAALEEKWLELSERLEGAA